MSWLASTLDSSDNVATLLEAVAAQQTVLVSTGDGVVEVVAREPIALCHKIALADIAAGADIIKYGQCVGEATTTIARGSWVHIHNVRSRRARMNRGHS